MKYQQNFEYRMWGGERRVWAAAQQLNDEAIGREDSRPKKENHFDTGTWTIAGEGGSRSLRSAGAYRPFPAAKTEPREARPL